MSSSMPTAILWERKGQMPALRQDSLLMKAKDALSRISHCAKCCWEFSRGVSQKPRYLVTWAG